MAKRLSANAAQPRPHFPFPGYPTVAAAGLYLCLSGGCGRAPGSNDPGNTAGSVAGGTTGSGGTTSAPGTGGITGNVVAPFDDNPPPPRNYPTPTPDAALPEATLSPPDASAPDVLPPAPDADLPDTTDTTPPMDGAALPPEEFPPSSGFAPIPY